MSVTGASMARGRSRQDYETPWEFIKAVENRFGKLTIDLAASFSNCKADAFFNEKQNSLSDAVQWSNFNGLLWLNPPFDNIAPWAKKCAEESAKGARILFLTPASVGSNWFAEHVYGQAKVLALRPRLSFDGNQPYPKDCILSYFTPGVENPKFECWKWK